MLEQIAVLMAAKNTRNRLPGVYTGGETRGFCLY